MLENNNKTRTMVDIDAGVVEYVSFAIKPDIDHQQFIDAVADTEQVLKTIDGYQQRLLGHQQLQQHRWVEVVFWRDQQAADQGLAAFQASPQGQALLALIVEDSVLIEYTELVDYL